MLVARIETECNSAARLTVVDVVTLTVDTLVRGEAFVVISCERKEKDRSGARAHQRTKHVFFNYTQLTVYTGHRQQRKCR